MKITFSHGVLGLVILQITLRSSLSFQNPRPQAIQQTIVCSKLGATFLDRETILISDDEEDHQNDHQHVDGNTIPMHAGVEEGDEGDEEVEGQPSRSRTSGQPRRHHNPATGDTNFLRKRTADLMRLHSGDQHGGNINGDHLKSKMKADRKTFNWLIDQWAFSGELDAADKAIGLLRKMEELDESSNGENHSIRPDVRTYTKVINALSRSGRSDAGHIADEIVRQMENQYITGKNDLAKPNTHTYTALVEAYANSGAPDAAFRAEELCTIMVQKWETGDAEVKPTARSFNAAISAWAKSEQEGAARAAESILYQMNHVFVTGNPEAKPNAYNYNSVINAWANSNEVGSAQRAEELLGQMEALYRAGDQDVKPTTVTFNSVIDAWAKSGDENAGVKAEEILRHMEDLYHSGENTDAKPNARSFNSVINVWARSNQDDGPLKAEGVLDLMKRLYEEGNQDVQPDVHSFSTVINAWAKSRLPGKAQRALGLFREMKKSYEAGNDHLRPNVVSYNAVMNACAFTNGDAFESNKAVEIAQAILKDLELSDFGSPDQVTYGTFLQVCANQIPACDSREKLVTVLFNKCIKAGQVGNMVLKELKFVASEELYQYLTGVSPHEEIRMEGLPKEWYCNVVEGKRRRRKWRVVSDKSNEEKL